MDLRHTNSYAGLSVYACLGWWGGVKARRDGPAFVITLGFISFGFMLCDLERMVGKLLDSTKEKTS